MRYLLKFLHKNSISRFANFAHVVLNSNKRYYGSENYSININVNNVSLKRYLEMLEEEYHVLKQAEHGEHRLMELQPIISILTERKEVVKNLETLVDLLEEKDEDLRTLAEEEINIFKNRIETLDSTLKEAILPLDEDDKCNAIVLEVNAGVGGQEAMLFAGELFEMYSCFAEYKGWEYTVAEYSTSDLNGLRYGSMILKGKYVFRYFKYEAGVHRVQRIPATEKSGRIHTSTVSVVALPQPTDIEIKLSNKDLKIETKRATGAGGQHVNTTDSAVRIVHLPTGIAVECQMDRSQIKNRAIAMERLQAKLYQIKLEKQASESSATRKSQVRSNFRNEKIRTYNFSQDRISDHRLQNGTIHNLKTFMMGNEALDHLIVKLHRQAQVETLLNLVKYTENKR